MRKLTAAEIDKGIEDAALLCERAARTVTEFPGDVIALSAADHLRLQLNPRWYRQPGEQAERECPRCGEESVFYSHPEICDACTSYLRIQAQLPEWLRDEEASEAFEEGTAWLTAS